MKREIRGNPGGLRTNISPLPGRSGGGTRARAGLPAAGIVDDELADAPQRRRGRVPDAAADEASARLQVDVERRRAWRERVEQPRALPTYGALSPENQVSRWMRNSEPPTVLGSGTELPADRASAGCRSASRRWNGAHRRLVPGLVREEPRALVVAGEAAQEPKLASLEIRRHRNGIPDVAAPGFEPAEQRQFRIIAGVLAAQFRDLGEEGGQAGFRTGPGIPRAGVRGDKRPSARARARTASLASLRAR